jgi:hypothetical protein
MTVHGCTVRSPLTGCQVTSRPHNQFLRYSKWTDTFWTALVFWSISAEIEIRLLKKIIRIMTGSESRTSCKPLFQSLEILTLLSQYILFLIKFLSHGMEIYTFNFTFHGFNTRYKL